MDQINPGRDAVTLYWWEGIKIMPPISWTGQIRWNWKTGIEKGLKNYLKALKQSYNLRWLLETGPLSFKTFNTFKTVVGWVVAVFPELCSKSLFSWTWWQLKSRWNSKGRQDLIWTFKCGRVITNMKNYSDWDWLMGGCRDIIAWIWLVQGNVSTRHSMIGFSCKNTNRFFGAYIVKQVHHVTEDVIYRVWQRGQWYSFENKS